MSSSGGQLVVAAERMTCEVPGMEEPLAGVGWLVTGHKCSPGTKGSKAHWLGLPMEIPAPEGQSPARGWVQLGASTRPPSAVQ